MAARLVFLTLCACALVHAEVAKFTECDESSASVCSVTEVRIEPCDMKKRYALLTRGVNTQLSFDFTPNFAATSLKSSLFWANGATDVEFDELQNADSCKLTTCPTEAGKSQTVNYSLYLGKKLPKGTYTFKWKTWNDADATQMCCFKTTIKLK